MNAGEECSYSSTARHPRRPVTGATIVFLAAGDRQWTLAGVRNQERERPRRRVGGERGLSE